MKVTTHSTLPPSPGAIVSGGGRTAILRFPYSGELVARIKQIPSSNRTYDSDTKCWSVYSEDGTWAQWAANTLQLIFPYAEIIYDDDPAGLATSENSAFATLYLLPTAPASVVRAAYRALSLDCHPDRGGSHLKMVALNAAYAELQEQGAA